jgi:uncharacterized surface protein with fasciclin (FAS1) repeats
MLQLRQSDQSVLNTKSNENGRAESQHRKKIICAIGGVVAIVVVAVLVAVIVVVTRPKTSPSVAPVAVSSKPTPAVTPSSPPTSAPANPCDDFPCSSNLTVMELVDAASNHKLLAAYLNRPFNSDLRDMLSSGFNVTLFAPTDQSFKDLSPPFSFYFQGNFVWEYQLHDLLATQILLQAENTTQIFQSFSFETAASNDLTVDPVNMTIGVANQVNITFPNIQASNGYIQVPDRVIIADNTSLHDFVVSLDYAVSNKFTQFSKLVQSSGLAGILQQFLVDGLTLFIPNDSAFDLLDENVTKALFQSPDEPFIKELILYHIKNINLPEKQLLEVDEYASWMYNNVTAWLTNTKEPRDLTFINTAEVGIFLYGSNGYVYM